MKTIYTFVLLFTLCGTTLLAQWEKVKNLPAGYDNSYWLEMYFLPDKPNYGWVCGYDGKVLRTTDMGRTWNGTTIRGAYQLEHIHFVDEKIGFTSGIGSNGFGKIYKTTDGGVTWFDITPFRAEDLWGHWFVDKDYGVVIGGGCITPQRFFLTTNGGNSWDYFTEIDYFPNSGLTDVIIYSRNGLGYATSSGYIWKTTDGGKSWQVFSRSGNNDWQEDLWISGNTIIVPYSLGCGGDGGSGGVRSTRDFGKTWKQFPTGTSMFGAFLHDSLRGWVCGWDRAVYYTANGGDTWTLLNCGIDPGVSLDDFWFINDTLGWVVGSGIYKFVGVKKVVSKINVFPDTTACEGDTIVLKATNSAKFYRWSNNSVTKEIKVTKSGTYELISWDTDCDTIIPATVNIKFFPKPKISLSKQGVAYICEGNVVPLWYITNERNAKWSDGRKDTIYVTSPGRYVAYATNEYGCTDSAFVEFKLISRPKIQSIGRLDICEGDSVILFIEGNFSKVEWFSNSDTIPIGFGNRYVAKKTGSFFAKAFAIEGCVVVSDTITINVRMETNAFEILLTSPKFILNFDSVNARNNKCLELPIKNRTDEKLVLDYIFIKGNTSFSTIPSEFPLVLEPKETKSVHICFAPNKIGQEQDTIIIFDKCWDQYVFLVGLGIPNYYDAESSCNVKLTGKTVQFSTRRNSIEYRIIASNAKQIIVEIPYSQEEVKVQIFNQIGEQIFNQQNQGTPNINKILINLDQLPSGLYFIRVYNDTTNLVFPILLEK
ncbi:MAG: T9SS type A sorting domain-containing protein [Ignavibacteria bacterium]|nr:T9SS type A sorting domain-containing protein [Ignavibacteria bacterium]